MKSHSALWRGNTGSAAIEFAILSVPLLMLAFGVYEFGRAYWTMEALQESAAQGARCVGIGESSCDSGGSFSSANTAAYVQQVASGWGLTVPTADITSTNSTTCGSVSGFAQVQITYNFVTVVPKFIPLPVGGKTLTVQSCYPNNVG